MTKDEIEDLMKLNASNKGFHPSKNRVILKSHLDLLERTDALLLQLKAVISCLGCKTLTEHEKRVLADAKKAAI